MTAVLEGGVMYQTNLFYSSDKVVVAKKVMLIFLPDSCGCGMTAEEKSLGFYMQS